MKQKLIISACLIGISCRYDGKDNVLTSVEMEKLKEHFILILVCPEQLGGLPTPRLPAEIQKNGDVLRNDGANVSNEFKLGAAEALKIAKLSDCKIALLKAHSPSCGNKKIYDGSFKGKMIEGQGLTVKLFEKNTIKVYNENEIQILIKENGNV
jgi:uncharacterized protein YbbK (DUF523 family)